MPLLLLLVDRPAALMAALADASNCFSSACISALRRDRPVAREEAAVPEPEDSPFAAAALAAPDGTTMPFHPLNSDTGLVPYCTTAMLTAVRFLNAAPCAPLDNESTGTSTAGGDRLPTEMLVAVSLKQGDSGRPRFTLAPVPLDDDVAEVVLSLADVMLSAGPQYGVAMTSVAVPFVVLLKVVLTAETNADDGPAPTDTGGSPGCADRSSADDRILSVEEIFVCIAAAAAAACACC